MNLVQLPHCPYIASSRASDQFTESFADLYMLGPICTITDVYLMTLMRQLADLADCLESVSSKDTAATILERVGLKDVLASSLTHAAKLSHGLEATLSTTQAYRAISVPSP